MAQRRAGFRPDVFAPLVPHRAVSRYVDWVIRRKLWVLLGCLLLSLASAWVVSGARQGVDLGRMFLAEDPRYAELVRSHRRYGSEQLLVVGVETADALSAAGLERLRAACEAAAAVRGVRRVSSVLETVWLEPGPSRRQPVRAVTLADELARGASPQRLRERLLAHPLCRGRLIADDGSALAVAVELAPTSASELPGRLAAVRAAFEAHLPAEALRFGGAPQHVAGALEATRQALRQTTPLVALVLLLAVWLLFGRLWPAAISLGVAAIAMLWSLALSVRIQPEFSVMSATVPGVILIIAFSDIVHLCSAYLLELGAGRPKDEAIREACAEVGSACLFTSLTTLVGSLSLTLIPVPAFRMLGIVLGFGVATALLLAVTLVPILFHLLPAPVPFGPGRRGAIQDGIDRALRASGALASRRSLLVIAAFAALLAISLASARQLTIETDFAARLDPSHPIRQDAEWFAQRFSSTRSLQLLIDVPDKERLVDPDWIERLAALEAELLALPEVDASLSLITALRLVQAAVQPDGPDLPPSRFRLARIQRRLREAAPEQLRAVLDDDGPQLRLLLSVRADGMRDSAQLASKIESLAAQRLAPARCRALSLDALMGSFLDRVVAAQRDGLLLSTLAITLLMCLGLRSLGAGLLSMIPNLLPVAGLGGWLAYTQPTVDSDAVLLAFVALGIGVDDAIHMLTRYRLERRRGLDSDTAMDRTFAYAGRGVVMTTVILVAGLLPFLLSNYFLMQLLGSLLPLTLVVALVTDVLLIPAFAARGWLRF